MAVLFISPLRLLRPLHPRLVLLVDSGRSELSLRRWWRGRRGRRMRRIRRYLCPRGRLQSRGGCCHASWMFPHCLRLGKSLFLERLRRLRLLVLPWLLWSVEADRRERGLANYRSGGRFRVRRLRLVLRCGGTRRSGRKGLCLGGRRQRVRLRLRRQRWWWRWWRK